jgi:hypothetical protein
MSEAAVAVTTRSPRTRPAFMNSRLLFLVLALALVLVCRLLAAAWLPIQAGDFELLYASAIRLLQGETPYQVGLSWVPYPLPAVLLVLPFTVLPVELARPVFDVLVGWALAYALWKYRGPYALLALLSGSYLFALFYGQPAPLMVAASLIPALGFLLAVRPQTSVALWVARPAWGALAGVVGFVTLSLMLPTWPRDWWMTLPLDYSAWAPPILRPLGALVLLGALRWRLPEGRLLLALAFLPQTTLPYELIALALIPKSWGEMALYAAGSWIAVADATGVLQLPAIGAMPLTGWTVMLFAGYIPMLFLVLRRPSGRPRARKDGGLWAGKDRRRPHRLPDDELKIEARENGGQHIVTVIHLPTQESVTESGASRRIAARKAHDKLAAHLARTARLAKQIPTEPK